MGTHIYFTTDELAFFFFNLTIFYVRLLVTRIIRNSWLKPDYSIYTRKKKKEKTTDAPT